MCDVAKQRHFYTKESYKKVSVLVWTKRNWLQLHRLQTAVFCLNVLQRQKWKHFAKNKRLLRTESFLIQPIFTEYRQKENLLMRVMSRIMPLLRHIRFFCTFARWFCKTIGDFVLLHVLSEILIETALKRPQMLFLLCDVPCERWLSGIKMLEKCKVILKSM